MSTKFFYLALLGGAAAAASYVARGDDYEGVHAHPAQVPARLVRIVRDATRPYVDVYAATAAGYGPFLGCVSGSDHGAMGIHYVNLTLYADGEIDGLHPEALIYEPKGDRRHLVGVEYIVDATTWLAYHNNSPPVLEGQVFNLVTSPNRYNLPAFFELHVWAWRGNPQGAFVDWNNTVSCEGQPDDDASGEPPDPGGDF